MLGNVVSLCSDSEFVRTHRDQVSMEEQSSYDMIESQNEHLTRNDQNGSHPRDGYWVSVD